MSNGSRNRKRPRKDSTLPLIYCDQNALSTLEAQDANFKARLYGRLQGNHFQFVFSSWHWVEMARNQSKSRALQQAGFADSLNPHWLRDRLNIQSEEATEALCLWLNVPFARKASLTTRAGMIAELNRVPLQQAQGLTSSHFVNGWHGRADLLKPLTLAHRQNESSFGWILKNLRRIRKEKRRLDMALVSRLLPAATLRGIVINDPTRRSFVEQFDLGASNCKTLIVEQVISEDGWSFWGRLRWQNFIDRMHLIPAMPHVEYFLTDDKRLQKLIKRVKKELRFPAAEPLNLEDFSSQYL